MRRHGRVNTCAGCLPKVTGVQRLPPVLAARQKSPPEAAAEGKFLTHISRECWSRTVAGTYHCRGEIIHTVTVIRARQRLPVAYLHKRECVLIHTGKRYTYSRCTYDVTCYQAGERLWSSATGMGLPTKNPSESRSGRLRKGWGWGRMGEK